MWPMSNDRVEAPRPEHLQWLHAAQEFALEAADTLRAAVQARGGASPALQIMEKAAGDWCSELDASIEQRLRQRVAERFPEHGFWGEEGHVAQAPQGGAALTLGACHPVWVVDPIDGSMNFLRGYPQYAVSVAVVKDGVPVVACIVDPVRQEVFTAAAGAGAWCNGSVMRVAGTSALGQAVAATVFPKPQAAFMDAYLEEFNRAVRQCAGVRRSGSMALELAYLAAGRVDAFWERGMGAWDAAAGLLLIREAGGLVWALDGRPWWDSGALAACVPGIEAAWSAVLQGAC